jgi:hypothetical protein
MTDPENFFPRDSFQSVRGTGLSQGDFSPQQPRSQPLQDLSSSFLNTKNNMKIPIWSTGTGPKGHLEKKKIVKSFDNERISTPENIHGTYRMIIFHQKKMIEKLNKKYAFLLFKFHQMTMNFQHKQFPTSVPSSQCTGTPKKRRYENETILTSPSVTSQQSRSSQHDHLNEIAKNIFTSPTRNPSSPTASSGSSGTWAGTSVGNGRARDSVERERERDRQGMYSTPERNRPPKHPPSNGNQHLLSSSSPLRPTLFTAPPIHIPTPPPPLAPRHESVSHPPSPPLSSNSPPNQQHLSPDDKILTTLSSRLNDLEQLIRSLDLRPSPSPPAPCQTTSSASPPSPPLSPPPSPPQSGADTDTLHSPLLPTNLSIHTAAAAPLGMDTTARGASVASHCEKGEIPSSEGKEEPSIFHSKALDALRTLHATHREYHHTPLSPTALLQLQHSYRSQSHIHLRNPSAGGSPSPGAGVTGSSSSSPIPKQSHGGNSARGSVSSPRELMLGTHRVLSQPQVPLTELSLVQSKMSSWRKRYTHSSSPSSSGSS